MRTSLLREKFRISFIAVTLVALALMLSVRMLGKTARFHYIEREHLALVLDLQRSADHVQFGQSGKDEMTTRKRMLETLAKMRVLHGCVPEELTAVEVMAFRWLGFTELVEIPGASMAYADRMMAVLKERSELAVSRDEVSRMAADMNWLISTGHRFGPLVSDATGFVKKLVLAVNLSGIVVVLCLVTVIRRATLAPLERARGAAQRIAGGDLAGPALPVSNDEVGHLNSAIDQIKDYLCGVVGDVRERSVAMAYSMDEVAGGSSDLSKRTEQQAATLQQTSVNVGQMSQSVRHIGQQLRQADLQAGQARQVAGAGGEAVAQVVVRMDEIMAASRRIADINDVVNGIAFQTNILALNAAVEAARAGEQGRGFAVVASEVRSLAKRCGDAAREIAGLIGDTTSRVEEGASDVAKAGKTIDEAVQAVDQVTQLVASVSRELTQQETELSQINDAMGNLDSGTQQNAAMAEQSMAAAEAVRAQARQLVQTVDRFALPA